MEYKLSDTIRKGCGMRLMCEKYPHILDRSMDCHACSEWDAGAEIMDHLNFDHNWTREAIADWIEKKFEDAPW